MSFAFRKSRMGPVNQPHAPMCSGSFHRGCCLLLCHMARAMFSLLLYSVVQPSPSLASFGVRSLKCKSSDILGTFLVLYGIHLSHLLSCQEILKRGDLNHSALSPCKGGLCDSQEKKPLDFANKPVQAISQYLNRLRLS